MLRGFEILSRRTTEDKRLIWQRSFSVASSEAVEKARKLLTTTTTLKKPRHKIPRKRASSMMSELRREQTSNPLPYPAFRSGDALEVKMLPYKSAPKPVTLRGVVLGKFNRGIDTSFILRDVVMGEVIERRISLHSPLIQDLQVLQQAFIHRGKKRVRRSKLYYLRDLDPNLCKVTGIQF